jgi:hypothetical protein
LDFPPDFAAAILDLLEEAPLPLLIKYLLETQQMKLA